MIEELVGRTYGPVPLRVCRERVSEFVAATNDDPGAWTDYAPPGWAAVLLFAVAPQLLSDPDLGEEARSVIHGEQRFQWSGPIPIEDDLQITGRVTRTRERGGVWFVGFDLEAGPVAGTSSFLMSGTGPPGGGTPEGPQRSPVEKESGEFSASRADLIRYAAASRDWNPIHWDHQSAVTAGLGGIVVHGLLQAAWILRQAVSKRNRPDPLTEARFRFRSPLLVGESAQFDSQEEDGQVMARLSRQGRELVAANLALA